MAIYSHGNSLISVEVKQPVFDFLTSGLHQVERVLKGPRPRQEVPDEIGYQTKGVFFGSDSQEVSTSPSIIPVPEGKRIVSSASTSRGGHAKFQTMSSVMDNVLDRSSESSTRNLPSLTLSQSTTNIEIAEAEAAQVPLKLISDTVRHVLAGTAARTMAQAFIHPIDTIKTRMQVNKATASPMLQTWRQHSKEKTLNVFVGRHRVLRVRHWLVRGPLDLYRGLTCAILGTIPVAMIYFSTYETCKGFLERRGASGTNAHLASASMGAVMSAFVRVPTDTLRHQTQAYLIPNFVEAADFEALDNFGVFFGDKMLAQGARSILATQGIRGLYHGLLPTLLRDVPELTLQFSLYEALRYSMQNHGQVKKLRTWQHLVLGGISGAVAATATMPLDVTKTALQCGSQHSVQEILSSTIREKGIPGLFAGMGPRVAQIALQGAIFFTLFEAWKAQLKPSPMRLGDDRYMSPKLWRKRRGHVWKRQFVFQ